MGDLVCCVSFIDWSYLEKENWRANNDRLPPKPGLPPWKLGPPQPLPCHLLREKPGNEVKVKVSDSEDRGGPNDQVQRTRFPFRSLARPIEGFLERYWVLDLGRTQFFTCPHIYNFLNLVSAWFWRYNMWRLTNSASIWYKTAIFRYLEPFGSLGDLAQALTMWLLAWRNMFFFFPFQIYDISKHDSNSPK